MLTSTRLSIRNLPYKFYLSHKYSFQKIIMNKRPMSTLETELNKKKSRKHWSLSLLETMNDPNEIYKETERVVVIRDKYPKAKIHYLMLPRNDINSIYRLNKAHIDLLEEFGNILDEIKAEHKDVTLRAGFHAVPSMQRLHMHIISTDMVSPCLKTKAHWNNFTTNFFRPYQDVLVELKQNGSIMKISIDVHKTLLATPLKCNQCSYEPKNMPNLKEHLLKHIN